MITIPSRRDVLTTLAGVAICGAMGSSALAQTDPLPSWNDSDAKRAILGFVSNVTRQGGAAYVAPAERIAVFDNDGTLWAEQPIYFQVQFAIDRVKKLSAEHPEWKDQQPFKAVIEGDMGALAAIGEKGILEVMAASHAGMTMDSFAHTVAEWLATARHPRFNRRYDELIYQPQLELLRHLRVNGFKTFIVSGGGVEFMRVFAERTYGIPPEQVIGSSGVVKFILDADGKPVLVKEPKVEFIDDGPGKPVGIHRFIGRLPILAFGNSDGDYEMLQWTGAGPGARLMAILHHTDGEREYAYDRESQVGKLDKALDEANARGWIVVDMKRDWKRIFPFEL